MRIGGSEFVHNAIEFDYCIKESLASLCAFCDEVVVLDAESTDGTLDLLHDLAKEQKNLRVVAGAQWNCAENYLRLSKLANLAKSYLSAPWHFMLQADEVVHESSFKYIQEAVRREDYKTYRARRFNLCGDLNHCFKIHDMPHHRKPCNDAVIRLGVIDAEALGDAESLDDMHSNGYDYVDQIVIFHYGIVRRDANFLNKCIDMQSWFGGQFSQPDHRIVEMRNTHGRYDWEKINPREHLMRIPMSHPIFAQQWVAERQPEKVALEEISPSLNSLS
jgi:glycosyltransferase involved in cell wall biosynthesis